MSYLNNFGSIGNKPLNMFYEHLKTISVVTRPNYIECIYFPAITKKFADLSNLYVLFRHHLK